MKKWNDFKCLCLIVAICKSCFVVAQSINSSASLQIQQREAYEWEGEIPTYVEQLKQELTYPMAWGNSSIKNFSKWKKAAREKVLECMMTPPKAAAAWDMQVLEEEQRDGYKAQKIAFNVNAYSRITAYLLVPDGGVSSDASSDIPSASSDISGATSFSGKGTGRKFPAVNLLHDHGAHLFIGKEKMIRPFGVLSAKKASVASLREANSSDSISDKEKAIAQEVLEDADAWVKQLYEGQYLGDYLAKHGYVVFSMDAPMWG